MVLPAVIAEENGLLEDSGIEDIDLVSIPDPSAMFQAVVRDQLDVGVGVPSGLVAFNEQNNDALVFFGSGLWMGNSFVALEKTNIPVATQGNWEDTVTAWRGKVVGVPALGGVIDKIVRAMIVEAGLSETDVDIVAVGSDAAAVAALEQGTADVVLANPIGINELNSKGIGEVVLEIGGEAGPDEYESVLASGLYTSRGAVDDERIANFADVWQAGVDFMMDEENKDVVIGNIADFLKVNRDVAESFYAYRGQYDTTFDEEVWNHTLDSYVEAGVMPEPEDRDKLIAEVE